MKQQHAAILIATFLGSLFPSSANFNVSKHIQVVHGFGASLARNNFVPGGVEALECWLAEIREREFRLPPHSLGTFQHRQVWVCKVVIDWWPSLSFSFCIGWLLGRPLWAKEAGGCGHPGEDSSGCLAIASACSPLAHY